MKVESTVTGRRKAAIVALLAGEEATAEIFKHLSEEEVAALLSEMAALGRVAPEVSERILQEFHETSQAAGYIARGDMEFARRVLHKTFGPEVARRMLDRVTRSFQSTAGFASLERADPQQLSKFMLGEHPQTIALILAHLNPSSAAQLATLLPDGLRVDVLTRMASLEAIEENRPDLAVSIRNLMFVFDDLASVDDNGMREIIQRADKKGLTIALK